MNRFMWSSPEKPISEENITAEHMRVLEEAAKDCMHYDIRTSEVYAALDYLQSKSLHRWGFTVFKQGLEQWNPSALHEGLRLIKQHLNF